MVAIAKPDYTYLWASGGNKVAPPTVKIQTGWIPEPPPYQYENWSQNRQDQAIAHIFQRGVAQWDALTDYEANICYVTGSDGLVYKSVAASGPSNLPRDPVTDATDTYWKIAFANKGAIDASEITTGVLPVVRGGTGVGTSTGSGSVVLSTSPVFSGNPTAPTANQFDSSTSVATTGFVQRALGNFRGEAAYNVNTQLTVDAYGRLIIFAGTSTANRTFTLPQATTGVAGSKIVFWNNSAYVLTILPFSGDFLDTGTSTPTSITLGPGSTLTCETFSATGWRLIDGTARLKNSAEFSYLTSTNGYQKLPSGLIVQWGTSSSASSNPTSVTFPIAFPTACLNVNVGSFNSTPNVQAYSVLNSLTTSGFTWSGFTAPSGQGPVGVSSSGQVASYWIAIGY